MTKTIWHLLGWCALLGCAVPLLAQEGGEGDADRDAGGAPDTAQHPVAGPMTNERIGQLLGRLDGDVRGSPGRWSLRYQSTDLLVITDEDADRLRIMTPAAPVGGLGPDELLRMLQANFDAVLDARYAIARDLVWSVFVHPLSSLTDRDFFSGLAQTIIATRTFGTSYSSGGLIFRGGDSEAEQQKLYDRIMREGETI